MAITLRWVLEELVGMRTLIDESRRGKVYSKIVEWMYNE